MNPTDSLRMASRSLWNNKISSSLAILGMLIGNAAIITMIGIGQASQKLASKEFESLGPNVLFVVPGSKEARSTTFNLPKTLVLADADAIKSQVPTVTGVAPQINSRLLISSRSQNTNSSVIGTTPEFVAIRSFMLQEGTFFSNIDLQRNSRVAVLGSQIANELFTGQTPVGKKIKIKNITFEIIGVMKPKGSFLGINQDEKVYIPLTTMANNIIGKTSPFGTELTIISISARNSESVSAARFQIENLLRIRHKITGEDDFRVETQEDILSIVNTVTSGLTVMLTVLASTSLIVGGVGVMNIMLVSVKERTQEIGLKKAIGARRQDILLQFLIETIMISTVGGILGTALGTTVLILVGLYSPLPLIIAPKLIMMAVTVSGSIGFTFGLLPAYKAANLDPIVALRST